jgi:GxxExxY protein
MTIDPNKTTETMIGAAIEVHRQLGPGLLESAYEACLAYELVERGLRPMRFHASDIERLSHGRQGRRPNPRSLDG